MSEEARVDDETGEQYIEQIIIAENKKLRKTIDLFDITSYEEFVNDKGVIYGKRCALLVGGDPIIVTKSYEEVKDLIASLGVNDKVAGFGRDTKEA